jgi:hypothetical protein
MSGGCGATLDPLTVALLVWALASTGLAGGMVLGLLVERWRS